MGMSLHNIRKRMDAYAHSPVSMLAKSRRLKSLQHTESMLTTFRNQKRGAMQNIWRDLAEADERLDDVRAKLKELRAGSDTIVTEHALLRYMERYMGTDLEVAYMAILELDKADVVLMGNTIVTVYPNDQNNNPIKGED